MAADWLFPSNNQPAPHLSDFTGTAFSADCNNIDSSRSTRIDNQADRMCGCHDDRYMTVPVILSEIAASSVLSSFSWRAHIFIRRFRCRLNNKQHDTGVRDTMLSGKRDSWKSVFRNVQDVQNRLRQTS